MIIAYSEELNPWEAQAARSKLAAKKLNLSKGLWKNRRRVIAENDDFTAFAPFASHFPFEMGVFPKFHSSAFSRISSTQIKNLAGILRDVLQRLDHTLGGAPYNLALQDRPFLRRREGYWNTIEDDFHWHLQILPQIVRVTGVEWASWFFYNPVPPEVAARCLSP